MEATFFDLLNEFHLKIAAVGFLAILPSVFLFWKWLKSKKTLSLVLAVSLFIGSIFFNLVLRTMFFPGGGLYDTYYDKDKFAAFYIQDALEAFKADCGHYPSLNDGLAALVEKPNDLSCKKHSEYLKRVPPNFEYQSDGVNYEVVGTRRYSNPQIFVRGTNSFRAKLFIKKD